MRRFSFLVLSFIFCLGTNSERKIPIVKIDDPEVQDLVEFGYGFLHTYKDEVNENINPICEIKKTEGKTVVSFIFKSIERYDLEWYNSCYFECAGQYILLRDASGIDVAVFDSVDCKIEESVLYYGYNITFENKKGKCYVSELWTPFGAPKEIDFQVVNDTCFSFTENDEWPFEKDSSIIYLDYEESKIYWNR